MAAALHLSKDFISVDFAGYKVWYDQANLSLVLLSANQYSGIKLRFGSTLSNPFKYAPAGKSPPVFRLRLCRMVALKCEGVGMVTLFMSIWSGYYGLMCVEIYASYVDDCFDYLPFMSCILGNVFLSHIA